MVFDGVLSRDFHQLVRKELTVYQRKRARTNVNSKKILICGFNSRMSETVCLRNKKYDMVVINAQLDNFSLAPSSAPEYAHEKVISATFRNVIHR